MNVSPSSLVHFLLLLERNNSIELRRIRCQAKEVRWHRQQHERNGRILGSSIEPIFQTLD